MYNVIQQNTKPPFIAPHSNIEITPTRYAQRARRAGRGRGGRGGGGWQWEVRRQVRLRRREPHRQAVDVHVRRERGEGVTQDPARAAGPRPAPTTRRRRRLARGLDTDGCVTSARGRRSSATATEARGGARTDGRASWTARRGHELHARRRRLDCANIDRHRQAGP